MDIQKVIDWCDAQVAQEKEVVLKWEGGGDSGWVYMEVDGEQVSSEEAEWLIDQMSDQLDYGSWAGEFSANGEATYDTTSKEFLGIDVYSEDEQRTLELPAEDFIEVRIPKKFYFETLELQYDNVLDGDKVNMAVTARNGIISDALVAHVDSLEHEITEKSIAAFDKHVKEEINGSWQHIVFRKDDAESDDANVDYIFKIKELDYYGYATEEKTMHINLLEMLEDENN